MFTQVLIKFLYALANDDGDMKSGLLLPSQQNSPKLKGFFIDSVWRDAAWFYSNGGAA